MSQRLLLCQWIRTFCSWLWYDYRCRPGQGIWIQTCGKGRLRELFQWIFSVKLCWVSLNILAVVSVLILCSGTFWNSLEMLFAMPICLALLRWIILDFLAYSLIPTFPHFSKVALMFSSGLAWLVSQMSYSVGRSSRPVALTPKILTASVTSFFLRLWNFVDGLG